MRDVDAHGPRHVRSRYRRSFAVNPASRSKCRQCAGLCCAGCLRGAIRSLIAATSASRCSARRDVRLDWPGAVRRRPRTDVARQRRSGRARPSRTTTVPVEIEFPSTFRVSVPLPPPAIVRFAFDDSDVELAERTSSSSRIPMRCGPSHTGSIAATPWSTRALTSRPIRRRRTTSAVRSPRLSPAPVRGERRAGGRAAHDDRSPASRVVRRRWRAAHGARISSRPRPMTIRSASW